MRLQKKIKGRKVLIIGLKHSGEAAALLARQQGARVYVSELANNEKIGKKAAKLRRLGIAVESGAHTEDFFEGAKLLIKSPGVKNEAFPILWARKNLVPVISEIEFASWFCPLPVIAITGTNGKTTVTTLIGKIIKDSGKRVIVCGNIGNPFSGEFSRFSKADVVVLEVSSFQLQHTHWFRPQIAVILNVTQNHFDHHHSFQEYFLAKAKVFANQKKNDFAVLNFEDSRLRALSKKLKSRVLFFSRYRKVYNTFLTTEISQGKSLESAKPEGSGLASDSQSHKPEGSGLASKSHNEIGGRNFLKGTKALLKTGKRIHGACYLQGADIVGEINGRKEFFVNINQLKIKGLHNAENAMAAILAASAKNIVKEKIVQALKRFSGVEHRCENVALINGIRFINDSKSTTVDATVRALSMFAEPDVILICGGRDKGSDFSVIRALMKQKVRLLVVMGEAKEKIINVTGDAVPFKIAQDMKEAVDLAFSNARPKDTVLLSPMCASFDMFENYEQRGRVFKNIVRELNKKCH